MNQRNNTLDLVRGVSALFVMLSHLRGFLFLDYGEIRNVGILTKAFYFATGLGHQAVMVFFVLSGYFVGGSVLREILQGSFSWKAYATARLTRLWIVLIPALVLTLGLDLLGQVWNAAAYSGSLHGRFMGGPTLNQPAVHDAITFLGNLCFLQNIAVPIYGTNGPLWSLANEFWYYTLFPLLAFIVLDGLKQSGFSKLFFRFGIAFFLMLELPRSLVLDGLVWLMGAGVWWLIYRDSNIAKAGNIGDGKENCRAWRYQVSTRRVSCLVGGLLFLGTLAGSKFQVWFGSDYAVGGAFAVWLLTMPRCDKKIFWWRGLARGLSEISYTLYVTHFPLIFFVCSVIFRGEQFHPDPRGFLIYGALVVLVCFTSFLMWWSFEKNTSKIRHYVKTLFFGEKTTENAK